MVIVTVLDKKAKPYKARTEKAARWLMQILERGGFSLEVYLVGPAQMDKNVLAFPADPAFPRPDLGAPSLGEVHLNPSYIETHGEDFEHMLTHGVLHLLGYDHEKNDDRMNMERREHDLLNRLRA